MPSAIQGLANGLPRIKERQCTLKVCLKSPAYALFKSRNFRCNQEKIWLDKLLPTKWKKRFKDHPFSAYAIFSDPLIR